MGAMDMIPEQMLNQLRQQTGWKPFYEEANDRYPGYQTTTGLLNPALQVKYQPVQGGSTWERNMLQKQAIESQAAMDRSNAANSSAWATARSNLAMRGGLDSGARERLARDSMRDRMMAQQEQNRNDQMARLGIGAQGEQQRIDLDKYNNENRMKTSMWNIDKAMEENKYKNMAELERYKTYMQGWAADRTADATENAGKK